MQPVFLPCELRQNGRYFRINWSIACRIPPGGRLLFSGDGGGGSTGPQRGQRDAFFVTMRPVFIDSVESAHAAAVTQRNTGPDGAR